MRIVRLKSSLPAIGKITMRRLESLRYSRGRLALGVCCGSSRRWRSPGRGGGARGGRRYAEDTFGQGHASRVEGYSGGNTGDVSTLANPEIVEEVRK